jgi:hypothetical protein
MAAAQQEGWGCAGSRSSPPRRQLTRPSPPSPGPPEPGGRRLRLGRDAAAVRRHLAAARGGRGAGGVRPREAPGRALVDAGAVDGQAAPARVRPRPARARAPGGAGSRTGRGARGRVRARPRTRRLGGQWLGVPSPAWTTWLPRSSRRPKAWCRSRTHSRSRPTRCSPAAGCRRSWLGGPCRRPGRRAHARWPRTARRPGVARCEDPFTLPSASGRRGSGPGPP